MDQLAALSEDARELALGRFRLLQPHIENGTSLRLVAEDAGIPCRTAQRWVGLYHEFGLVGLSRKNRTDKGEPRAVSVQLREVIEGLALQRPPLPFSVICRQVRHVSSGRLRRAAPNAHGLDHERCSKHWVKAVACASLIAFRSASRPVASPFRQPQNRLRQTGSLNVDPGKVLLDPPQVVRGQRDVDRGWRRRELSPRARART